MVRIRDIAVVKKMPTVGNPVGEAPVREERVNPMSAQDRTAMCRRLTESISELIDHAKQDHDTNHPDGDLDYITRLSTNEFYFYTKEPLTLEEFEQIQNGIADKLKETPPGIQLVLGSFAVKTEDNKVMNVTPHITSGDPPDFNLIIKNYTSSIDVRYKGSNRRLLRTFDVETSRPNQAPEIVVQGKPVPFSFNNVIQSKTPGRNSFLTLVDICLDHAYGIAKRNFKRRQKQDSSVKDMPVSHMVVSNSISLEREQCVGAVMHVDPIETHKQARVATAQRSSKNKLRCRFGKADDSIYKVNVSIYLSEKNKARLDNQLHNLQSLAVDKHEISRYINNIESCPSGQLEGLMGDMDSKIFDLREDLARQNRLNRQIETLKTLAVSANDVQMRNYIDEYLNKTKNCSPEDLYDLMDEMDVNIEELQGETNKEVLDIIDKFKRSFDFFGKGVKAKKIESAYAEVPIEERMKLSTSTDPSVDTLKSTIASHRHSFRGKEVYLDKNGNIDEDKAARSYKEMKAKFKKTVAQASSDNDAESTARSEVRSVRPK